MIYIVGAVIFQNHKEKEKIIPKKLIQSYGMFVGGKFSLSMSCAPTYLRLVFHTSYRQNI